MIIVDSGVANLASVVFALERLGVKATVTRDVNKIKQAAKVILPGVGAAQAAMCQLEQAQLLNVLKDLTQPVLGICLGMQLLFDFSEENNTACLSIMPGRVKKLTGNLVMPHMGWNKLTIKKPSPLLFGIDESDYFYFVHSFAVPVITQTCATSEYGQAFSAVCQHENFFATQFHPERSGKSGEKILKNFLEI